MTSALATGLVVVMITVLTIIFGELVPKRLGQMYPEAVARLVSRPMNWLSAICWPVTPALSSDCLMSGATSPIHADWRSRSTATGKTASPIWFLSLAVHSVFQTSSAGAAACCLCHE